jgi:hypothetical protein
MAYTYHGKSTLIALPGESQRVINGNVIVIEKDYAIRKSELANVLADMAPGKKMPGTNYIIDTQPQFQLDATGFARVRLSALNVDFTKDDEAANFSTSSGIVNIAYDFSVENQSFGFLASFSFQTGVFRYLRTVFEPSQDPNFPDIFTPILFNSYVGNLGNQPFKFETKFGPSKWVGTSVDKVNLYENRVFQYTAQAICAPSFIRIAGDNILIQFDLTDHLGGSFSVFAANGLSYVLRRFSVSGVEATLPQPQAQNRTESIETQFRRNFDALSYQRQPRTIASTARIQSLRDQLNP